MLSGEGIISAERGVAGGYRLATSPENITVGDIVRVLADDLEIVSCANSFCAECASGSVWKRLKDGINGVLNSITLQSLIDDFEGHGICKCHNTKKEKQEL